MSNNSDSNRFVASRFEELPLKEHMFFYTKLYSRWFSRTENGWRRRYLWFSNESRDLSAKSKKLRVQAFQPQGVSRAETSGVYGPYTNLCVRLIWRAGTGWCSRFCVPSIEWAKLLLSPMNPQELAGLAAFKPAAMSTYLKYACQAKFMAILSGELCSLWWHWSPCPTPENRQFSLFFAMCMPTRRHSNSSLSY